MKHATHNFLLCQINCKPRNVVSELSKSILQMEHLVKIFTKCVALI